MGKKFWYNSWLFLVGVAGLFLTGCAYTKTFISKSSGFPLHEGWEIAAFAHGFEETTIDNLSEMNAYKIWGRLVQMEVSKYEVRIEGIELRYNKTSISGKNSDTSFEQPTIAEDYKKFGNINITSMELRTDDSKQGMSNQAPTIPENIRDIVVALTVAFKDHETGRAETKFYEFQLVKLEKRSFAPFRWIGDRLSY